MLDKRSQEVFLPLNGPTMGMGSIPKVLQRVMGRIGQGIGFQISPEHLHRIQFRGISGKEIAPEGRRRVQQDLYLLGPMGLKTVPDDQERLVFELADQLTEEGCHLRGANVGPRMESKIAPQLVAPGGNAQGRDNRNLLMRPPTLIEQRGLAPRGPGSTDPRGHQKPRLVNKDQACL